MALIDIRRSRFLEEGYNLDVCYVTDRIIVMGFPAGATEGYYRNRASKVKTFLDTEHGGHYRVYNLCSERQYDSAVFDGHVAEFLFDEFECPPYDLTEAFCSDCMEWLNENPMNVIVVHCRSGKGRTGTMVSILLLRLGMANNVGEAVGYFTSCRTKSTYGVSIPSQLRYIGYHEIALAGPVPSARSSTVLLRHLLLSSLPAATQGTSADLWVCVRRGGSSVFLHRHAAPARAGQPIQLDVGLLVSGDVTVEIFHRRFTKGKVLATTVNTRFLLGHTVTMHKREIDIACLDAANARFPPNFTLNIVFGPAPPELASGACIECSEAVDLAADPSPLGDSADALQHMTCMQCTSCGRAAQNDVFIKGAHRFCLTCASSFFDMCTYCRAPLRSLHVAQEDCLWHADCYVAHKLASLPPGAPLQSQLELACVYTCGADYMAAENDIESEDGLPVRYDVIAYGPGASMRDLRVPEPATAVLDGVMQQIADMQIAAQADPPQPPASRRAPPPQIETEPRGDASAADLYLTTPRNNVAPTPASPFEMPVAAKEAPPTAKYTCKMCGEGIFGGRVLVNDESYHDTCFACDVCHAQLPSLAERDGKFFCEPHYAERYASRCATCERPVVGEYYKLSGDRKVHRACLRCHVCRCEFNDRGLVEHNGIAYCLEDYAHLFMPKCATCKKDVVGTCLTLAGKRYHHECLQCLQCATKLDADSIYLHGEEPFCLACLKMLLSTRA